MAGRSLGTLTVDLILKTGGFEQGLDKADRASQHRFNKMAKDAEASARRITLALTAVGGALVAFTLRAAQNVTQQKDLAESIGLTVEKLSELTYGASQSGVKQEQLGVAVGKLTDILFDAANGNEKAGKTLAALGINLDDVRNGSVTTESALRTIAETFSKMPDGINKSALSVDAFGKAGRKMIPFLNDGTKGLDDFAAAGHAAGAIMSDVVAKAVDDAEDAFDRLNQTLQTKVIVGWAALLGLIEATPGDARIAELTEDIADLNKELEANAGKGNGFWGELLSPGAPARIAQIRNELAELNRERQKLIDQQLAGPPKPVAAGGGIGLGDGGKAHAKLQAELEADTNVYLDNYTKRMLAAYDLAEAETQAGVEYRRTWEEAEAIVSDEALPEIKSAYEQMSVFADEAARNMQSAFADFLFDPFKEGVKGMLQGFADMLRRMAAEALAQQLLTSLFNAFGTNAAGVGYGTSLFGGARAEGGPTLAGKAYIVGERGPELFMPKTSGNIIPNGGWGGGESVNVTYNMDNRGMTAEMLPMMARMMAQSEARTKSQVFEALRRGTNA